MTRLALALTSTWLPLILALLISLPNTGCSAAQDSAVRQAPIPQSVKAKASSAEGSSSDLLSGQESRVAREATTTNSAPAESQQNASAPSPVQGGGASVLKPQIIKTARLSLQIERMDVSMKALEKLTAQHQGIITNQSLYLAGEGQGHRSGSLEVRVPENHLSLYLEQLGQVGKITEQQLTGTDVGTEIVDTEARVRNLKSQEEALQGIMRRAGKISDILEVTQELSNVRGQIETAQSRVAYLRQQVAYSTVTITLKEKNVTASAEDSPSLMSEIGTSMQMALNALYGTLVELLQILIWLALYVLPICAIGVLCVWGFCTALWKLVIKRLFKAIGCCQPKTESGDKASDAS